MTPATRTREQELLDDIPRSWAGFIEANDELKFIQREQDFSSLTLSSAARDSRAEVLEVAKSINGPKWNYWSNALQKPVVETFDKAVQRVAEGVTPVDYLEIGSCQGLSMGLIGTLLRRHGRLRSLTSVDPYWEDGYDENGHLEIDKGTKERAFRLYGELGLPVRLVEAPSFEGLPRLIRENASFGLIYVDGRHESLNPTVDFGLAWTLLDDGGVLMLDDHRWADVAPLKALCDEHLESVHESWKVAAYVKRSWK